jgi:hypothetical protein
MSLRVKTRMILRRIRLSKPRRSGERLRNNFHSSSTGYNFLAMFHLFYHRCKYMVFRLSA